MAEHSKFQFIFCSFIDKVRDVRVHKTQSVFGCGKEFPQQ